VPPSSILVIVLPVDLLDGADLNRLDQIVPEAERVVSPGVRRQIGSLGSGSSRLLFRDRPEVSELLSNLLRGQDAPDLATVTIAHARYQCPSRCCFIRVTKLPEIDNFTSPS
jgi:hypothetical protein